MPGYEWISKLPLISLVFRHFMRCCHSNIAGRVNVRHDQHSHVPDCASVKGAQLKDFGVLGGTDGHGAPLNSPATLLPCPIDSRTVQLGRTVGYHGTYCLVATHDPTMSNQVLPGPRPCHQCSEVMTAIPMKRNLGQALFELPGERLKAAPCCAKVASSGIWKNIWKSDTTKRANRDMVAGTLKAAKIMWYKKMFS